METELKFQVPDAAAPGVQRAVATRSAQSMRLQAVYAETAGLHLAAAGLALRLRKEGRVWVQTLKGRGDGLMSRLEHEVRLPPQRGVPVLDLQRHAGTAVGDRLTAALPPGAALQPLYRTDIRRLHRTVRHQGALIEIAYDCGWLHAGPPEAPRRLAVQEIEFELVRGPATALPDLALRWTLRHGLWWDSRTKSERGMRLALGRDRVPATPHQAAGARGWPPRLLAALAQVLPNAAEIVSGLHGPEHGAQLQQGLRRLKTALRSAARQTRQPEVAAQAHELLAGAWPARPAAAAADGITDPAFQALLLRSLHLVLMARSVEKAPV